MTDLEALYPDAPVLIGEDLARLVEMAAVALEQDRCDTTKSPRALGP